MQSSSLLQDRIGIAAAVSIDTEALPSRSLTDREHNHEIVWRGDARRYLPLIPVRLQIGLYRFGDDVDGAGKKVDWHERIHYVLVRDVAGTKNGEVVPVQGCNGDTQRERDELHRRKQVPASRLESNVDRQDDEHGRDHQEHDVRDHLQRKQLTDLRRVSVQRVQNHRAVDRNIVFGNEVGRGRADNGQQYRRRLDRPTVSDQDEERDEQAQSGHQVRGQSRIVQRVVAVKPLRQLAEVERVADRIEQ